jgi:hypothetical protein
MTSIFWAYNERNGSSCLTPKFGIDMATISDSIGH